jgi:hypothetical protein
VTAATAKYRRLSPSATEDKRAVSGEVNRMIAAAINVDPRWFWGGRMCECARMRANGGCYNPAPAFKGLCECRNCRKYLGEQ